MELIWITEATYIEGYKIRVKFNTGSEGIVDLKNVLSGPIFEPLKDQELFKDFKLNAWTIEWSNGADNSCRVTRYVS